MPATVTVVSLPITWAHTCSTASGITGLTLPGMIDDPFCSSGRRISPRPARGPLAIHRRSLQILVNATATTFNDPDVPTSASRDACAAKWSSAGWISAPTS